MTFILLTCKDLVNCDDIGMFCPCLLGVFVTIWCFVDDWTVSLFGVSYLATVLNICLTISGTNWCFGERDKTYFVLLQF